MLKKELFKNPQNDLEGQNQKNSADPPAISQDICVACPQCKELLFTGSLTEHHQVCPKCGHHFKMRARERIVWLTDAGTFLELDEGLVADDPIAFPGYAKKLNQARSESGEKEAVVCGTAEIEGLSFALFVMEPYFMMGSMGMAVGEKITRLFEYATKEKLPVLGFTLSGGARMQEGILSLMQMAKTSGAVKRHSDAGNLYVTILTHPTTGGITASFAMQGDLILAEPGALIGFAGPRVIEQTIRQSLPEGFQRAEFLLERGFVDAIVSRETQKEYLARLLFLHTREVV